MKRRDFIAALGGVLVTWPHARSKQVAFGGSVYSYLTARSDGAMAMCAFPM